MEEFLTLLVSPLGRCLYEIVEDVKGDALELRKKVKNDENLLQCSHFFPQFCELYHVRIKAQEKFSKASQMVFTKRGLEQSTGEAIAKYKATLYPNAKRILVLCSGIGGEAIHFALRGIAVVAIDNDPGMIAAAKWNAWVYGVEDKITFLCTTVEDYLEAANGKEKFDAIFVDPDRRSGERRMIALEDYSPNILRLKTELLALSDRFHIKVSPMLSREELHKLPATFSYDFIQEEETLKEILIHSKSPYKELSEGQSAGIYIENEDIKTFFPKKVPDAENVEDSREIEGYLCEPLSCLMRAGLIKETAQHLHAKKIDQESALLCTKKVPIDYLMYGDFWKIVTVLPFDIDIIKKYLQERNIRSVVLMKRYFPVDMDDIVKMMKLPQTGAFVLYFTTCRGRKVVILGEKMITS